MEHHGGVDFYQGVKRGAAVPVLLALIALGTLGCQSKGLCARSGVHVEVEGNHAHLVKIPGEAVDRGVGGTYRVQGDDHEHAVLFSDADFKKLQSGEQVVVRTSSVNGHLHELSAKCAAP